MATIYSNPERNRNHDPLRVMTVDPGTSAGWAMWDAGSLDAVGWVNGKDARAIAEVIRKCYPEMLIIERPHGGKATAITMRGMWLAYGRWATVAEYQRLPIEEVWAITWQSYLPGWRSGMKRDETGDLYQEQARAFSGRQVLTPDECAAVCLGWWYWGVRGVVPSCASLTDMEGNGAIHD